MEEKHSFDCYIRDENTFEVWMDDFKSFDSYINNYHFFNALESDFVQAPLGTVLWRSKVSNFFNMSISIVNSVTEWLIDMEVPTIYVDVDESRALSESGIAPEVLFLIPSPAMTFLITMLQELYIERVSLPFQTSADVSERYASSWDLELPSIAIVVTLSLSQYYMMNYYDSYLLSDLDANLLSDMDAVVT